MQNQSVIVIFHFQSLSPINILPTVVVHEKRRSFLVPLHLKCSAKEKVFL
jgi:hypothetical protein